MFKIAERAGDEWQYGLRHDRDFVEMQYKAMKETLTQEKEVAEAERKEAEAERKKLRVLAEKHPNPDMRDRLRVEYLTRYVK